MPCVVRYFTSSTVFFWLFVVVICLFSVLARVHKYANFANPIDCKTVVFGHFRKARSAVSVILACEAREPHTSVGHVRQENDCRLFIQRIRSERGSYNVAEVTEIA